jgi:hypothetical protein
LFLRLQDGVSLVRWAIEKRGNKIVEMLVNAGANVNAADKVGAIFPAYMCVPRLCILIQGTHTRLCYLFMRLQDGVSPVHRAIEKGSNTIVEMLVKAGANVNVADKVGVIFPASVRFTTIVYIYSSHSPLFLVHATAGRCFARSLGHQQGQRHDCGDAG